MNLMNNRIIDLYLTQPFCVRIIPDGMNAR